MICLPPHTTHRMQPLDRTIYGPLKLHYNRNDAQKTMGIIWAAAPASVISTPPRSPPAPAERPVVAPVLPSPMEKQELSTIEAAKFLNASHLFIAQEIDAGRLKCRQVGVDWRIAVSDLVTYALRVRLGSNDDAQRS